MFYGWLNEVYKILNINKYTLLVLERHFTTKKRIIPQAGHCKINEMGQ